ncbi:conserved hypothetical protein [Vibrio phage 424E50-1]|nr:conserved hypothetical protein [Vibrio phage 424E50-1]
MKSYKEKVELLIEMLDSQDNFELVEQLHARFDPTKVEINDCRLCKTIYRCTETLPELTDCIQLDPEGVFQIYINYYSPSSDDFHQTSRSINYCPECGRNL